MCLSYTYFIASIPRYIDINSAKDYQLKQNSTLTFLFSYHKKSVQIYLLIQPYIDPLICSANNLTGFYMIRCSFAQGTLALRKRTDFGKSSTQNHEVFRNRCFRKLYKLLENHVKYAHEGL